jgi:diaminopropionate ammonia-lyase
MAELVSGPFAGLTAGLAPLGGTAKLTAAAKRTASDPHIAHALQTISAWAGYHPTPIASLDRTAKHFDLDEFRIKTEAERFSIGSFKALGPPYAVVQVICELLEKENHDRPTATAVFSGQFRDQLRHTTVTAATSGNHGRALAWAAQRIGCSCVIFMPKHTGPEREANIKALGARVIRTGGGYDEALAAAQKASLEQRWLLIAEVPQGAHPDIPCDSIRGYAVIGIEIARQCADRLPSHVFASAGSGCMAAGIAAGLIRELGTKCPKLIVVEPQSADALFQSARQRMRAPAEGNLSTVMDGLAVRWPSKEAWEILETAATAILTIPDAAAINALRALAMGLYGDASIEIGETGVAAPAGALLAATHLDLRHQLGIGPDSRILSLACEGVTDRGIFSALVENVAQKA